MDKLFFKIWKNDILRNKILNEINFKFKFSSLKYRNVQSVSFMIRNRYYHLLYEKILKSEYLIFNSDSNDQWEIRNATRKKYDNPYLYGVNNNSIFNLTEILNYFSTTQPMEPTFEIKSLYFNLFKNYKEQFIENENIYITANILIEYDNDIAFSILINEFKMKLEYSQLERSFEYGSFKICSIIESLYSPTKSKLTSIKIQNSLFNHLNYRNEFIKDPLIFNSRLNFIINCKNLTLSSISLNSFEIQSIYNFKIYQEKLSTVIQCCNNIIYLKDLLEPYINSINNKSFKFKYNITDNNSSGGIDSIFFKKIENILKTSNLFIKKINLSKFINKFQNFKFTKQQLDLKIQDFNNDVKEISIIYKFLIKFTDFQSSEFLYNYNFYACKYKFINVKENFYSFTFGDFNLKELIDYPSIVSYQLFKYCNLNQVKKDKFIELVINEFKNNDDTTIPKLSYLIGNIITGLINNDEVKYVSLFYKQFSHIKIINQISFFKRIIQNIKSNEMFDCLFEIFKTSYTESSNIEIISNSKSLNSITDNLFLNNQSSLLKHYKLNYSNYYYSEIENIDLNIPSTFSNYKYSIFKFAYENQNDFKSYKCINIWKIHQTFQFSLKEFKHLVNLTPNDSKYCLVGECYFNNTQYLDYIYNNKPQDIINQRCILFPITNEIINYFQFKQQFDQFDEITYQDYYNYFFNNPTNKSYDIQTLLEKVSLIDIIKNGNLSLLNFIMDINYGVNNLGNNTGLVSKLFDEIIKNSRLDLLLYLKENYNVIILSLFQKSYTIENQNCSSKIKTIILNGNIQFFKEFCKFFKIKNNQTLKINHTFKSINNALFLNYFKSSSNDKLILKIK